MNDRVRPEHPQGEDGEWFVELCDQYYQPLYRYIFHKIDSPDAGDALQEVWAKAAQNPEGLKAAKNPKAWLYKLAHDEIVNWYRRNVRQLERFVELDALELENLPHREFPWERLTPLQLEEALMRLTAEQREVIVLHYFQDLTFIQISERLHIPLGTVESRHFKAIRRLRKHFEVERKKSCLEMNKMGVWNGL